jgi:hypothetical protein
MSRTCYHDHIYDHIHRPTTYSVSSVVDSIPASHWSIGSPPPRTESFGKTVQIGEYSKRVDVGTDANLPLPLPAASEDGVAFGLTWPVPVACVSSPTKRSRSMVTDAVLFFVFQHSSMPVGERDHEYGGRLNMKDS